jgi:ethanolamine utilization protein EutQ (cupin superfamily)
MNIDEIADLMEGKTIEDVRVVYGEDTLIIYLSDGSSIEIIVDSIYADIPEFDS